MMIKAVLPLPPSTNNLYINLKRGGRAKSVAYKDWLRIARAELQVAYAACGSPVWPDKTRMALTVRVGCNYRRDLTNCVKPVEDALCAFLPIPDDRYNEHVTITRDLDCEGFVVVNLCEHRRGCGESPDNYSPAPAVRAVSGGSA